MKLILLVYDFKSEQNESIPHNHLCPSDPEYSVKGPSDFPQIPKAQSATTFQKRAVSEQHERRVRYITTGVISKV